MSKQLTLFFSIILISIATNAADNYNGWWLKANAFYTEKKYDSAAAYYNKIAELHPNSAEVYYNLGNTYYKLNDIGKSVLNYERTLKLKPNHQQASDNLYLAEGRIENRIQAIPEIFFIRWWKAMTASNLTNIYAIIAILLFLGLMAYFILNRLGRIHINLPFQAVIASISVICLIIILSLVAADRAGGADAAIVIRDKAPLMQQPKLSGSSQLLVPEGTKVSIEESSKSWLKVVLPDGRSGWVDAGYIERI